MPLCVDLDGTLLLTDSLLESLCQLLRRSPWMIALLPVWLLRGKAYFKSEIARRAGLDVQVWPLNAEVLAYVQEAKKQGRTVVLATAADQRIATAIQGRLNLFDEIIASDGDRNRSAKNKADELVRRYGEKKFDYIGNSTADLPVWQVARAAGVTTSQGGLIRQVEGIARVERVFPVPAIRLKDWAKALRIHQWSKNLLLLVPLLSAHKVSDTGKLLAVLLGVGTFSLCASSVYLLNDLMDLESDRHHPKKRHRPFAAGKIPLLAGMVLAPLLLAASTALAVWLGWKFAAIFGVYYLLTLAYSLRLKQIELLDVLTLACLYGIRVLAGGMAAAVLISDWLMMYSLFLFLSLAFAKRYTEISSLRQAAGHKVKGRGYVGGDAELVSSMGVGSGYLSVLVLAMYINNPLVTSLYNRPEVLWLACPLLLYWVSRVWLLAHRGNLHEDPILFALRDRQSWFVVVLLGVIGVAAGPK